MTECLIIQLIPDRVALPHRQNPLAHRAPMRCTNGAKQPTSGSKPCGTNNANTGSAIFTQHLKAFLIASIPTTNALSP